jgi:membrane-bound serine protease (ClpP class)
MTSSLKKFVTARRSILLLFVCQLSLADSLGGAIWVLDLRGPIGPASAAYVVANLSLAAPVAQAVVLRVDTPGGLDQAMRDINRAILASPIPVLSYVEPKGARAASAGTYILYASHFAAMAPATNIGAATPVQIGAPAAPKPPHPVPSPKPHSDDEQTEAPSAAKSADAMTNKIVNDAAAYLRGLAELRGRNIDWAQRAVRDGASLSASQALELGVIDAICDDLEQLVQAAASTPLVINGAQIQLDSEHYQFQFKAPNWRQRLLGTVTNPNIAYLLFIVGCYGLLLEFYNPGVLIPGIGGAICLLLALYAFQILPISYAGLALMLLGVGLLVAEVMAPGIGLLGLGGAMAFAVGSLMLIDSDLPDLQIDPLLIAAATVMTALVCVGVAFMALRSRQQCVVSGRESMIGMAAEALEDFDGQGRVRVAGELWQAVCTVPVSRGERRAVREVASLTVILQEEVL